MYKKNTVFLALLGSALFFILSAAFLSCVGTNSTGPPNGSSARTASSSSQTSSPEDKSTTRSSDRIPLESIENIDPALLREARKTGAEYTDEVKRLRLIRTPFETLENISLFSELEYVQIYKTEIANEELKRLEGLNKLRTLFLTAVGVGSIEHLPPLPSLRSLSLRYNKIDDMEALVEKLREYPQLRSLYLDDNPLTNFSSLGELSSLEGLSLSRMDIPDIGWVKEVPQVKNFYLSSNKIRSIEVFESRSRLRTLYIPRNKVSDLSPLEGKSDLQVLSVSGNPVDDLAPLEECDKLVTLQAMSTEVSDISVLDNKDELRDLYLSGAELQSIEALRGKSKMRRLYLSGNSSLGEEALDVLISMKEAGSFSSSRSKIEIEDLGIDLGKKKNMSRIESLEEAGIEVSYRKGNVPPPFDADTGKPAPKFTLLDRNGHEVSLDDIDADYIYVQVSAEWCGYCHRQAEHLAPFHEELANAGAEKRFASVVMLSDKKDRREVQKKWAQDFEFDYVLIPKDEKRLPAYSEGGIPSITLIRPDRNIAGRWSGAARSYEEFRESLRSFIPEFFDSM